MSVPLEMPSSEMNVEAFNASDSDSKIDPPKTAIPKLCTNTTDQIDSTTVETDKLVISKVESSCDKDIDVTVKKDMDVVKCTITAASSTAGNSPTSTVTTTDTVAEAPKEENDDGEAVVSTPLDENINAQSNQELPPSTSEIVNIAVKIDSNDDDDSKKNLDEKQVNEPLSIEIKTKLDSEVIVKDLINRLSNEKIVDKQEQQPVLLQKLDDKQNVSSNVIKGGEVAKQGETTVVGKDEQESDEKADSSLEIIENLDDTDKSDEKMDENEDDDDDEEDEQKVEAMDEDDDEEGEGVEDDVLGEPLTLDEEEDCEEEVDEEEEVEHETSGNAILIDDDDDDEDAENEYIDEEEVEDEEDIDEDDIEEDEYDGVDNEEDDDIEEVIESDAEVIEQDSDNSEPEEMSQNIKLNSRKGVDKRYGPRFKSKMKRPRNFFAILKRRSIKWLTKKMHVMESDEMISTIPNDLTTPTVGCISLSGGVKKYKENDYRYNNIKDDEGIELIEEKDDPHHDDEPSDDDDGGEEDEEMEKIPTKLDDKKNSDSITNKKLNKNDSNVENSIIKNKILKQTDNNNSNSELIRSKSKTPPNVTSETLDLTSLSPQKNPVQPPELMKTDKEFKNDCNLVKKSAVVQEEQNISNNNNNNNNSSSDKKIKNEENVKLTNLSNDDIEMIEDNQAVDLSQEKQPTQQQTQTQPIELEIIDKDNNKNEKDNKIVASNQKSVKSPNINKTFSSSTADCDKKLEIKKEEKPYVEPKPQDQQQPLLKTSSSASSDKSDNKNSNENNNKEDSGDETKKSSSRSTQSGAIKRSSSPSGNNQSVDYSNPSKKHCDDTNSAAASLDQQSVTNNKTTNTTGDTVVLNELMEKSQNDTPDELKKNIDQIQEEIQSLDEMLKIKEQEWNNVLHLKKMKEEIFERLTRRKRINDIKSILSIGSMDGYNQMIASSIKQNNKAGQGDGTQQQPSIAVATLKDYTSNMNKFSNSASNNALAGIRSSAAQTILQNRANIKTTEQIKDKLNSQRQQRQILPKAPSVATSILQSAVNNNQNKILNYTSTNLNQQKKQSIHQQQQQDYLNGHQTIGQTSLSSAAMGRQGAIKDVQSIIADYRQKHPEEVPRRGRRLRPSFSMNETSGGEGGRDGNSRPSSADSSHSNSNLTSTPNLAPANAASNISFKDVLVKYAKMSPSERQRLSTGNSATLLSSLNLTNSAANKAYPEVTLHPLNSTSMNSSAMHSSEPNTNVNSSLLHGILTKNTTRPVQQYNTFSPTLARLLTAPERITPQTSALFHQNSSNSAAGSGGGGTNVASLTNPGVNLTKNHNEITITPVLNSNNSITTGAGAGGTFLKREAGTEYSGSGNRIKTESNSNLDDEADDSADRLVIDEGDGSPGDQLNMSGTGQEFHENEVPECQGCKKREAQFVCAGCGNQWYCSRECQVRAWDEHSDICTG